MMISTALKSAVLTRKCSELAPSLVRLLHATRPLAIKEGDSLPNAELVEGGPDGKVKVGDLFGKKRGVLLGVPGAFTPGCSQKHLPTYVKQYDQLKKKGVEVIACVSVNDPFVMSAWAKDQKTEGKVHMLADPQGNFIKALKMDKDLSAVLGNVRSKRFSMLLEDGKVKKLYVEPDGTGVSCTVADTILEELGKK
ncbi:putative Peroxiredoxin-5, mitochondrial [Hypsibius exemplaris]|uniref:Peroxiredoxin-5 n=1 Tax=Hypsibius exemplaris TaxID=2072580 RepID=A0A1W0X4W3_HYPEX|nr:putative Peroxiredoxin-5, mitochondrial [Hypsibius exemplaris]